MQLKLLFMATNNDDTQPPAAGNQPKIKKRPAKKATVPQGMRRILVQIPIVQHKEFEELRGEEAKIAFYSQLFQNSIQLANKHIEQKDAVVEKEIVEKIIEKEVVKFKIPRWAKMLGGALAALVAFLLFKRSKQI